MNNVVAPILLLFFCPLVYAMEVNEVSLSSGKNEEKAIVQKISRKYIEAQSALFQEALKDSSLSADRIVELSRKAIAGAKNHEKKNLLLALASHSLFSKFSRYLENLERVPGFSKLDQYADPDVEWEEYQLKNEFKEFLNFDKSETAIEVIQRYYNFTTILQKKSPEAYIKNQIVFFSSPANEQEIKEFEEANRIVLPKEYVGFIKEIGFFSFGDSWQDGVLVNIRDIIKKNIIVDLRIPFELPENGDFFGYKVKDFEKGFVLFENPRDNYRSYEIGFFLEGHKNKKGELLFINGDHDGFEEHNSFNSYIQKMVNSKIVNSLEY